MLLLSVLSVVHCCAHCGRETAILFGEHRSLSSYLNARRSVAVAGVGLEARYNPLVMLIYY